MSELQHTEGHREGESSSPPAEREGFDPAPYREPLVCIIHDIEALETVDEAAMDRILRRHPRDGKGFFSRGQIIAGFRHFAAVEEFRQSEEAFARRIQLRPVRSQSGVTP